MMPNEIVSAASLSEIADHILRIDAKLNEPGGKQLQEFVDLTAERDMYAVELAKGVKSLLASPADHLEELLAEMTWVLHPKRRDCLWAVTIMGEYFIEPDANGVFEWKLAGEPWRPCDSLESGKAACWEDYVGRLKVAFKGGK